MTLGSAVLTAFRGTGTLRFELSGTSLRLYVNDLLAVNTTDGVLAASGVGMSSTANGKLDTFAVNLC